MWNALLGIAGHLFASLVSPSRCVACDALSAGAAFIPFCATCRESLVRIGSGAPRRALFAYGGAVATAIARLKFGGRVDIAPPLSLLLAHSVLRAGDAAADLVAPVPLHRSRLVSRGYNQSALLARPVAHALRASFEPRLLVRTRATTPQTELVRGDRKRNVEGAFAVREAARVCDRSVLLIDDVRTTGATLEACTRALRSAGARDVTTLVVAQTEIA